MKKKLIIYYLCNILLIMLIYPIQVFANGPKPANNITIEVENKKKEAAYIDILIKLKKSNKHYTTYNQNILNQYNFSQNSDIVTYNKNGYISYSIHFKGASSQMQLKDDESFYQFAFGDFSEFDYICNVSRKLKIVLLDTEGNILLVSPVCKLNTRADSYLSGNITYDATKNKILHVSKHTGGSIFLLPILYLLIWVIPLTITLITECVIAKIMKLTHIGRILYMNIMTNYLLFFLMSALQVYYVPYIISVLVGELLVYLTEYCHLYYRVYKKGVPSKKILQYTILANSASWLITFLPYIRRLFN